MSSSGTFPCKAFHSIYCQAAWSFKHLFFKIILKNTISKVELYIPWRWKFQN